MDSSISLIIRSREEIVFTEDVEAVTSINESGIFDVLPKHANFISLIKEFVLVHKKGGEKEEIKIGKGVLRVRENRVSVYLVE